MKKREMKGKERALLQALSNMFGTEVYQADYQTKKLDGGTVGDVYLVSGRAETVNGCKKPYNIILKTQQKWERQGDVLSWRREYDLYRSDLAKAFVRSFRWPQCYYAKMNEEENETQIWLEYIQGISGLDLTGEMYERSAFELGRFQGKLYLEQSHLIEKLTNLSSIDFTKSYYNYYRSEQEVYDYIRSQRCEIPKHLQEMLVNVDEKADQIWLRIEKLPIVLCHRDFWVTNIFYTDGNIVLIDWDTTGWGYMGEDIASLIADEADVDHMVEYYQKCVPAYYKGISEYVDVSHISDDCIYELMLVMFGYRLVEWYKFAETSAEKNLHLKTLERIYEIGRIKKT